MGKSRRVALMLELDWPYARHVNVFAGTQRYADECGNWDCVVDETAHESLRTAKRKPPYDGIIARITSQLAKEVRRCGISAVNVWYNSPVSDLPKVVPDFALTGQLAAEHLLGLGLRRFACLSSRGERADAAEVAAFHDVLAAAGCSCRCTRVNRGYGTEKNGWQHFHETMERWTAHWQPPLGVYVAFGGMTARHVVTDCRKRGLRVPEDVALIAGVNEPILCLHPAPSLSSIEVPYDEMGYQAVQLLDRLMDGEPPPAAPVLIPPVGVIARRSTNCLAVSDEAVCLALQFIVANSHREISIRDVADAAHASRRTLERRFVAVLDRSIADEIRRQRIERAKRYLADPSLPVKSVAVKSGFANEQRLYEAFYRREGISPSRYPQRAGHFAAGHAALRAF